MLRLPNVVEGILGLHLPAGDNVRFHLRPDILSRSGKVIQKQTSILDIYVIPPRRQLHGEELMRRQGTNLQVWNTQKQSTRGKAVDISLGGIVQPVGRETELGCDARDSSPKPRIY